MWRWHLRLRTSRQPILQWLWRRCDEGQADVVGALVGAEVSAANSAVAAEVV